MKLKASNFSIVLHADDINLLMSGKITICTKLVYNELDKLITGFKLTNYVPIITQAILCSMTTTTIQISRFQLMINQYQNKAA